MCLKPYQQPVSSLLSPYAQEWKPFPQPEKAPLQPYELLPHLILPPHSQPPQTTVPMVVFASSHSPEMVPHLPPLPLPYFHSDTVLSMSSYQSFVPYSTYIPQPPPPTHQYPLLTFPATGNFSTVATPISGGMEIIPAARLETIPEEEGLKSPPEKVDMVIGKNAKRPIFIEQRKNGTRNVPPRMQRAAPARTYRMGSQPTTRKEWRPIKKKPDSRVSGGAPALPAFPGQPLFSPPGRTTLMLKNIPNQIRRDFLLKFLDHYCKDYSLEYDFLYLPMDFRSKDNLGYAFVNLTTRASALKLMKLLQNYKWETLHTDSGSFATKKICEVTWARIQGKEGLIRRFQNSHFICQELDFLPVVLDPPRNGLDPNPSPPLVLGSLHRRAFR